MLLSNRSKIISVCMFCIFSFLFASISNANASLNEQLAQAAGKGNLSQVKYLIEQGADINATAKYNNTALMMASEGGYLEIVKYLVEKGADVNAKIDYNSTALVMASGSGHLEVVKYLVEKGADVNAESNSFEALDGGWVSGMTVLAEASRGGHLELVKYLVEKGVDINIQNEWGQTALMLALRNAYPDNGYTEVIEYLKKHGAKE